MKKSELINNPFILFSPFLALFVIYILKMAPSDLTEGDPARYIMYANNMIQGFYSPPAPNILLRNGPGYPIVLIPFLLLKLPLLFIALMNAVFYYFSIVFIYKALKEMVSAKMALIFSLAWAFYYVAYQNLQYIVPETFTYFLISILLFLIIKAFKANTPQETRKYVILTGITLGSIVLTKMIFGYVLMFMLLGFGILWFINSQNINFRKGFIMLTLALLTTSPYLIYTYNLTGRLFYWGMGSDTLYWMSTPHKNEYGDWKQGLGINSIESGNYNIPGVDSILRAHHEQDLLQTEKYIGLEWDDEFKKLAIKNITEHPLKYAQNVFYNMGRLVFHFPFSYAVQRPKILIIFPIHGILLTLMLFSLIPTLINWRKIPTYLQFLLIFSLLYLGASVLVTTFVRMFTIVVPILLFWIAYIVQNTMKINLKFRESSESVNENK
jgi:4-amino-4-deoxy-L-arabinose transferase-like glycosyltransferase